MHRADIWGCDHCHKTSSKEVIRDHEGRCLHNPKMKACYTCIHKFNKAWTSHRDRIGCALGLHDGVFYNSDIVRNCKRWERKEVKE